SSALVTQDLEALVVDRGDLEALVRTSPAAALHILAPAGQRLRNTVMMLRRTASRNPNVETEDRRTHLMRIADWIAAFSGSLLFLIIHVLVFAVWIGLNTGPLARTIAGGWD